MQHITVDHREEIIDRQETEGHSITGTRTNKGQVQVHQLTGTAMGTNVAMLYAIYFMAYLEQELYQNVRNMYPQDYF